MVPNEILKSLLGQHPEFHRKLQNFCEDYKLHDKPSLIWQCHPIDESDLDVSARPIRDVLEGGVTPTGQDGWWYSFRSGRKAVAVFDGIAAHSASEEQGWVTEFHSDGHVIAGLWIFPEVRSQKDGTTLFVSDFHVQAFLDFGSLASKLYESSSVVGPCYLSCTMQNATQLNFSRQRYPDRLKQLNRERLQWRVRRAASADHIGDTCRLMADEFLRAYGFFRE